MDPVDGASGLQLSRIDSVEPPDEESGSGSDPLFDFLPGAFQPSLLELPPGLEELPHTRELHVLCRVALCQRKWRDATGEFALPLTAGQANSGEPGLRFATQPARYAALETVLRVSLECVAAGRWENVRAVYYREPGLFGAQAAVCRAISALCRGFELTREELRFRTTARGLVSGDLTLELSGGGVVVCHAGETRLLGPECLRIGRARCRARAVLVVEKDTVFQVCLQERARIEEGLGGLVLVTGRGYPDVYTRCLVSALGRTGGAPVLCLTDGDADGAAISALYAFGGLRGARLADGTRLDCPRLVPAGLWPAEVPGLAGVDAGRPATARDRSRLEGLLGRLPRDAPPVWAARVRAALAYGRQHELEALAKAGGGLAGYVRGCLASFLP